MTQSAAQRAPLVFVAGRWLGMLLAPLGAIVLPGVLGEEGYGQYGFWFGLVTVLVVFLDLGGQPVLRRFLPEFAERCPEQGGTLFRRTLRLKCVPLLLLVAAVFFSDRPTTLALLVVAALAAALATNLADVYYAYERMGTNAAVVLVRRLTRLVLVPLGFVIWGLPGVLAGLVVTEVLGLLVALPAWRMLSGCDAPLSVPFRRLHRQGLVTFGAMLMSIVLGRLPVLTAEWTGLQLAELGRLALCVDLTYFALKELINTISEAIFPRLITHRAAGRRMQADRITSLNYRVVNFGALATLALGLGLANSFLPLLGSQFYMAERELMILMLGVPFGCWNFIHSQLLLAENRAHGIALSQAVGLAVNACCLASVWPRLTTISLSVALTLAMVGAALTSYLATTPRTSDGTSRSSFLRLLPLTVVVVWFLRLWHPAGLLECALAALAAGVTFTLVALLTRGLPMEDIRFLLRALRDGHPIQPSDTKT